MKHNNEAKKPFQIFKQTKEDCEIHIQILIRDDIQFYSRYPLAFLGPQTQTF